MTTSGPLADALVLDLSRALAGPHAAMMLGDLGARVIKVESPGQGDDSRTWGPPFVGDETTDATYYLSCNRNKESVQLDFKSTSGHEALCELIRRADVLIENFRPGVFDRLGFSPAVLEELNPRLVVLSISGFGSDGPESERPGYDLIAQGESGLMSITGPDPDHPTRVGVPIGDLLAGIYGAFGVVSALHDRSQTGRGSVVRTSLLAALVGAHAFHGTAWTTAGKIGAPSGNHHPQIAPYGAFRCANGTVQVAVGSEGQWRKFANLLGLDADDERFATNSARLANRAALIEVVEDVLLTRRRDHWLSSCNEAGVPAGAVRTIDEVYEWEQSRSQGLVVEVEHPVVGTIEIPGPPLRFESFAGKRLGRTEHTAPPTLGQHTSAVSKWLEGR